MWQAILGAIGAAVVAVLGFLFHKRGDEIKDLEEQLEEQQTQSSVNETAYKAIIEGKEKIDEIQNTDKDVDTLVDIFNSGDKL